MKITKSKRLWVNVLCLSVMVFCTFSVQAAGIGYSMHIKEPTGNEGRDYSYDNSGTHRVRVWKEYKCIYPGCTEEPEIFEEIIIEPHSPVFSSIGHWGDDHHYRGVCVCGYTTTVTVSCPGGNSHVTP